MYTRWPTVQSLGSVCFFIEQRLIKLISKDIYNVCVCVCVFNTDNNHNVSQILIFE